MTVNPRLAVYLANREADYLDTNNRPIDDKLATAAVNAANEAVHIALGLGRTGTDVRYTVMDWVRANPRPPGNFKRGGQVGHPTELKAWVARAEVEVTALLEKLA
jgi:hypothetical protein